MSERAITRDAARPCSVVLPTFRESQSIRQAVGGVIRALDRPHEVIVVDDSPSSATADAVRAGYGEVEQVQLVRREDADGLASAVLRGWDEASHDVWAVMDADLQHPPGALAKLLRAIDDGADCAVGSRHVETGRVAADWPLHRRAISWGATAMAWAAVPPARDISDPMSGLFVVDGRYVEAVRDRLEPHGYKILLEVLARAPLEDVQEMGYTFHEREDGSSNLGLREYARYVRHLAALSIPSRRDVVAVPVAQEVSDR